MDKLTTEAIKQHLQAGLISGAFPLLFGQGPLEVLLLVLLVVLQELRGGQMGGFAGGLVATGILQQLTTAIMN